MQNGDVDFITFAFGTCNLLRLLSYLPQIIAVARDRHGATAISFSCWLIWIAANVTTALYAWYRLDAATLALVSAFNAICCGIVILLTAFKRIEFMIQSKNAIAGLEARTVLGLRPVPARLGWLPQRRVR